MYFKAVNKVSKNIDGWGIEKSRASEEERWDLSKVDVIEISKEDYDLLIKNHEEEIKKGEEEYKKMWEFKND